MTRQILNSLGNLGDAMKGEKKRIIHRGPPKMSEPVYVKELVAILDDSISEAARRLAMSQNHISKGIHQNSIRMVTELAAKGLVMEMRHSKARPLFYFVEVSNSQKDVFDAFLRGMYLKATVL